KEFLQSVIKKKMLIQLSSIIIVTILLLLPLFIPYYQSSRILGSVSYEEIVPSIPLVQSYILSHHASLVWSSLLPNFTNIENSWCHTLYTGISAWLGILLAPIILLSNKFQSRSKHLIYFLLLALLLTIVFSLNLKYFSLY